MDKLVGDIYKEYFKDKKFVKNYNDKSRYLIKVKNFIHRHRHWRFKMYERAILVGVIIILAIVIPPLYMYDKVIGLPHTKR